MSILCPACSRGIIKITHGLELPPDCRSDEITLQFARCPVCRFEGVAIYEESRRGSLDSESVDHHAHSLARQELSELRRIVRGCPHPRRARCTCEAHQLIGSKNDYGRWSGLDDYDLGPRLALR